MLKRGPLKNYMFVLCTMISSSFFVYVLIAIIRSIDAKQLNAGYISKSLLFTDMVIEGLLFSYMALFPIVLSFYIAFKLEKMSVLKYVVLLFCYLLPVIFHVVVCIAVSAKMILLPITALVLLVLIIKHIPKRDEQRI